MVNDSVVQGIDGAIWTKGWCRTRRGVGTPTTPPAVCVKRAQSGPISGSGRRSGMATEAKKTLAWP
jgi:hypothetical protein